MHPPNAHKMLPLNKKTQRVKTLQKHFFYILKKRKEEKIWWIWKTELMVLDKFPSVCSSFHLVLGRLSKVRLCSWSWCRDIFFEHIDGSPAVSAPEKFWWKYFHQIRVQLECNSPNRQSQSFGRDCQRSWVDASTANRAETRQVRWFSDLIWMIC